MIDGMTEPRALTCANGALLEVPVFETHFRGTNWLAVIDIDGTMPGGLARRFIDRGKGACYYLTEKLALFDAVEFGADYTTGVGTKKPKRWYGVIVAMTDDALFVEKVEDGATAVLLAKKKRTDPSAMARALLRQREELLQRAEKLQQEAIALVEGTPAAQAEEKA